ncbi:hypothetical protein OF83DRAFT_1141321 [Amylostereum chailletii]|nr:hypothetical protein OF83DRAFT_1141321 [Amylostereum chailletii]
MISTHLRSFLLIVILTLVRQGFIPTTMTTHLPNELLVKIIEDPALSRTDLLHLRAADRKFRALASPHAFRVLHAGYTAASARALENLLNSQAVADYVEEISFEQEERVSQTSKEYRSDSITSASRPIGGPSPRTFSDQPSRCARSHSGCPTSWPACRPSSTSSTAHTSCPSP